MKTAAPLRLVPAESAQCRYSGCVTGLAVNPKTWPGDLGYCSACCMSLAELEEADKRLRIELLSQTSAAKWLGLGYGP